jgi:hypothetical protein
MCHLQRRKPTRGIVNHCQVLLQQLHWLIVLIIMMKVQGSRVYQSKRGTVIRPWPYINMSAAYNHPKLSLFTPKYPSRHVGFIITAVTIKLWLSMEITKFRRCYDMFLYQALMDANRVGEWRKMDNNNIYPDCTIHMINIIHA